jgi:hypothetical protein
LTLYEVQWNNDVNTYVNFFTLTKIAPWYHGAIWVIIKKHALFCYYAIKRQKSTKLIGENMFCMKAHQLSRNRPIRNKNCLWRPCLSTDRDEMCNLYRRPAIVASYQVSVHLAKQFEKRRFLYNRSIRNKNYLWRPCLLTDRDEMSNLYRRPSIVAAYQVSVHLAKNF